MQLPLVVWTGLGAALFFLAAIIVVKAKKLVKPKLRIKTHRTLAITGALIALVHLYLALRIYF